MSLKNPGKLLNASSLGSIGLLSVIAPVHNNEGEITLRVETLLDILTDARVSFEFLLLDFASTDSTTDLVSELERLYPQIKTVYFPELDINRAISAAIKSAAGDLIVILEEGPYAVQQLTQLLKESLQFNPAKSYEPALATIETASDTASEATQKIEIDSDQYDLSGRNFERLQPITQLQGIEAKVLQRLESWAIALKREAENRSLENQTTEPNGQSTSEPQSEFLPSADDEIRRLDPQSSHPKRKLPKFITRFHEFI